MILAWTAGIDLDKRERKGVGSLFTFACRQPLLLKDSRPLFLFENKCRRGTRTFDRITVIGHCGGDPEAGGVTMPGVTFTKPSTKPGNRLGPTPKPGGGIQYPDPKTLKCIRDGLTPNGILTLCACGYSGKGGWDQLLQNFSNQLGRTICACPTPGNITTDFGCWCEGGPPTVIPPVIHPESGTLIGGTGITKPNTGPRKPKVCKSPQWWPWEDIVTIK
jgi:hypothetical protein